MAGTLFIAFVIAAILGAILFSAQQAQSLNGTFQRLAQHYDGTFHPGGILFANQPSVRLQSGGTHILVDTYHTGGKNSRHFTQLHISWPDRHFRCEIMPQSFWSGLGTFFGMEDIEIGSPKFDEDYIIRGGTQDELRNLLTAQVQMTINQLRTFSHARDIYVLWSGGILLVKVQGIIRDFATLQRFTSLGLELFLNATNTRTEGIDFLDDPVPPSEDAVCQICGETIEDDIVFCRSCKTPHHGDCWQYYGACSTYGCGQKRFTLPRDSWRQRKSLVDPAR